MTIIIGIGDYAISGCQADSIKTFALGSCVALIFHAPLRKVLAMAHIALPDSAVDRQKGLVSPGYFADTAVAALLAELWRDYQCRPEELAVKLYGGSRIPYDADLFNVGARNIIAVQSALAEYQLSLVESDVGGVCSRTVEVSVATGAAQLVRRQWVAVNADLFSKTVG
jgi:chemotaxis protein CheD